MKRNRVQAIALPVRTLRVHDLFAILALVGATAASAWIRIPLPFTPVPITAQTLTILLGAAYLGAGRSLIAQSTYLGLGAFGFPLFAGGAFGLAYLFGPTGGYIFGFVFASIFVGRMIQSSSRSIRSLTFIFSMGLALIYLPGCLQLALIGGLSLQKALLLGMVPFLAGEIFKVGLAVALFRR
jgi:biotin transport system substrate-specific component